MIFWFKLVKQQRRCHSLIGRVQLFIVVTLINLRGLAHVINRRVMSVAAAESEL